LLCARQAAEPRPFLAFFGARFLSAALAAKPAERHCVPILHSAILLNAKHVVNLKSACYNRCAARQREPKSRGIPPCLPRLLKAGTPRGRWLCQSRNGSPSA
jgi:hypothetical protein